MPEEVIETTEASATLSRMWDEIRGGNLCSGQPRTAASEGSLAVAQRAIDLAEATAQTALMADAWCMMAYALNANENYPEAIEYYRRAIAVLDQAGEDHRAARIRLGFIAALSLNGHCADAIEEGRKAGEVLQHHNDETGLARLSVNMGLAYQRLDDHVRALECFNKGAALFERNGEETAVARICLNAAISLVFLDRFDEAVEQYSRCEEIAHRVGMTDLWQHARYNKAYIYVLTCRYSDALGMYVEMRQAFTSSRRHEALCDLDQCEIYLHLHLPHKAQILAERVFEAFEKLDMRYEKAKAAAFLGTALTQARQFGSAQSAFRLSQDLFEAQGNELWKSIIQLYRAEVLFSTGRLLEARSLAAAAQETFERLKCPAKQIVAIVLLGRIALDAGRIDEADSYAQRVRNFVDENPIPLFQFACHALCAEIAERRLDYDTARIHYELAAREFEKRHTHLHHDELGITFFKGKQEIYEALVEFSLETGTESGPEQAFAWCEKAKSQPFVDLLRNHIRTLRSQADLALLDRLHRIHDELNASYSRFRPEVRTVAPSPKVNEIDLKEEELIRTLDELSKTDSEYVSLHEVVISTLEAVQAAIPDHSALAEYFIAGDEILVFLIDKQSFRVIRHLSSLARVQYLTGQMRQLTARFHETGAPADRSTRTDFDRVLQDSYRQLIAPFIEDLDISRLIVVPHGAMGLLPFHAFFDGTRYLSEYLHVSTAPSASVFELLARRPITEKARGETISVCEAGSRAALASANAPADLIHIRNAVTLRQENPLLSSIEFEDAALCTPDVYGLNCSAGVVALTGRYNRTGIESTPDDLLGFVRGFLYAGALSVLTRLWNSPQPMANQFIEAFQQAWAETGSRELAMQHARRIVREQNDHPYYWAGFMLWGRSH